MRTPTGTGSRIVPLRGQQYARRVSSSGVSDLTTIKVPVDVRDRFALAARTRGVSMRTLLDELSRRALDAALMEQASQQMAQLRDLDPETWADYVQEGRDWEEGTIVRLDTQSG